MSADAAQRVRERLREWAAREGHRSKARIAKAVAALYGKPKSPSWVTGLLNGPTREGHDLRLKDLDAIAELLQIPPGELVRGYDRNYMELTMAESRLIEYYRLLPETIRSHWIRYLDYVFRPQRSKAADDDAERKKRTDKARNLEAPQARKMR